MLPFSFQPPGAIKLLLLFYLQVFNLPCYGQSDNVLKIDNSHYVTANDNDRALLKYIKQVDSVSHTTGVAGHFARIYTQSMSNINVQLTGMDSGAQTFIKKFEISFIRYFLDACVEYENKLLSSESVWNCYFSNPGARSWQLTLMGVNAHVNGDIWKGLVNNFSEQGIRRYKKNLLSFQTSISKAFQPIFNGLMAQSSYLRFINGFTKGMAKQYAEWLIYNWRLRQINLAILYYNNPQKFKKRLAIVNKKRQRIDRVILRQKNIQDQPLIPASDYDQAK